MGKITEQEYQQYFSEKIERYKQSELMMKEYDKRLETEKYISDVIYLSFSEKNRRLAEFALYQENMQRYFQMIEKSADFANKQVQYYGNGLSLNSKTGKMDAIELMLTSAILSRNKEKIKSYAEFIKNEIYNIPPNLRKYPNRYALVKGLILRCFILGQNPQISELIEVLKKLEKNEFQPKIYCFFKAMYEKDREQVIIELKNIIQYSIRTYRRNYDPPISMDGICLILFARDQGIKIDYSKDFEQKYQKFIPECAFRNPRYE